LLLSGLLVLSLVARNGNAEESKGTASFSSSWKKYTIAFQVLVMGLMVLQDYLLKWLRRMN